MITFDRLHTGYLGPYANDWIETPQWNGLATEAVLFDQCLGEPVSPDDARHGWWQSGAWIAGLRDRGVHTVLVTDSPVPDEVRIAFAEIEEVSGHDGPDHPETKGTCARLMSAAGRRAERLAADNRPALLWVRSRGVSRPWLPPREFVDLYLDEFGLSAPAASDDEESAVEVLHLTGRDSDVPYVKAMYAASASYVDRWMAKVLAALPKFAERPLVIVTAAAGEELGEHGDLGGAIGDPYSPALQVPLAIAWPGFSDGSRRPCLATSADVPPTVCEWFHAQPSDNGRSLGPVVRSEVEGVRVEIRIDGPEHRCLRTPDYYYVRPRSLSTAEALESAELFEKPWDRWDLANVASLAPGVVEELEARLAES